MRVYLDSPEPAADDDILDRLALPLVQAVALSELMIRGWVEPPVAPVCALSTLTQQIISVIAQTGGAGADTVYDRLCRHGAFGGITPAVFAILLRQLGSNDVIEQVAGGDLILGLSGEKIRRDRGFYAVFATPDQYALLHEGRRLGELEIVPQEGEHLLFAGSRWRVDSILEERHEVYVTPARGWRRPTFTGGPGSVHSKVRQTMREVLVSTEMYSYLDTHASAMLSDAREAARHRYVVAGRGCASRTQLHDGYVKLE